MWLLELGAQVTGLALPPETEPSLCAQLELDQRLDHRLGVIRDAGLLEALVAETRPELVQHLAAQPLLRRSYAEPTATWATNVMGTIHLLEALRRLRDSPPQMMTRGIGFSISIELLLWEIKALKNQYC